MSSSEAFRSFVIVSEATALSRSALREGFEMVVSVVVIRTGVWNYEDFRCNYE